MKYLYALLCLLASTAQAFQVPQTLTNLTNTIVQSHLIQNIAHNQTLKKLTDAASPIAQMALTAGVGLGGFGISAAIFVGWAYSCGMNDKNYVAENLIDPITKRANGILKKIGISKEKRQSIEDIPSALLYGLGTLALSRLQLKNHYANTALGGALIPIAALASGTRLDLVLSTEFAFADRVPKIHTLIINTILASAAVYLGNNHRYAIATGEGIAAAVELLTMVDEVQRRHVSEKS